MECPNPRRKKKTGRSCCLQWEHFPSLFFGLRYCAARYTRCRVTSNYSMYSWSSRNGIPQLTPKLFENSTSTSAWFALKAWPRREDGVIFACCSAGPINTVTSNASQLEGMKSAFSLCAPWPRDEDSLLGCRCWGYDSIQPSRAQLLTLLLWW